MITAIKLDYVPVSYHSDDGWNWKCDHASTTADVIEHSNDYKEAVTGMPQPLIYERIEECVSCPAWYSLTDGEWHDE